MAITSILELDLKPDKIQEGLAILRRVLVDTRAFDGCLSVTVIQDHDDPAHVLAIETWESLAHDDAYRAWRAGDGLIPDLPDLLVARRLTVGEPRGDV